MDVDDNEMKMKDNIVCYEKPNYNNTIKCMVFESSVSYENALSSDFYNIVEFTEDCLSAAIFDNGEELLQMYKKHKFEGI